MHADLTQIQEPKNKMQNENLGITNYIWRVLNVLILLMIMNVIKLIKVIKIKGPAL